MTGRKKRSDSTSFQAEIMSKAGKKVLPPDYVRVPDGAMPFWEDIIATKVEWTKVDLILAANLARCCHMLESEQFMLEFEGTVVENARGTRVPNARVAITEQLSRRQASLAQKLQVHAQATQGEPENNRKKNAAKRDADGVFDGLDDDDLIARPN